MGSILSFFAEHSPTIIKALSIIVAIAASFLLYRVIFVQQAEAVAQPDSIDLTDVNKKINEQKIEIDTLKSESETNKVELEKQRTEVYNLRQTIKEKEAEVESVKSELQQAKSQGDESKKLDYEKHKSEVILSTADENLVFQKEIAELKRRLSDYEIIAEDISDMQRLKEENEKLKQLVETGTSSETANSEVTVTEQAVAEAMATNTAASGEATEPNLADLQNVVDQVAEAFVNPSAQAPESFVPNEKTEIDTEVLGPGPGETASAEAIDATLAEATMKTEKSAKKLEPKESASVETETLDGVSEVEKNLLDKFEKQKET